MSKIINTRIKQKIDTFDNWMDTSVAGQRGNLIALEGEFIVYKSDASNIQPRIKVGDGVTRVYDLPFLASNQMKNVLSIPFAQGKLEYNGSSLSPSWMNYDLTKMNLAGQTSGIDAGTYTALFTPKDGYCWEDGSTSTIEVEWEIGKKKTGLLVVPDKLTFTQPTDGDPKELRVYSETQLTINAGSSNSGAIVVTKVGSYSTPSNDSNYSKYKYYTLFNVGWSGQSMNNGVTLTFTVNDNNHDATVTCSVNNSTKLLNDYTWEEIADIASSGDAKNYFDIGDTKAVTLDGYVTGYYGAGNTTTAALNGTYNVFIIDFNHTTEGSIQFSCFKNGTIDCGFGIITSASESSLSLGGWAGSYLRYFTLGSTNDRGSDASASTATSPVSNTFMSCLPSDLRAVMQPMTVYSNNLMGTASSETPTVDYLPLMSEYEVLGKFVNSYGYITSAQRQYTYYANGNAKTRKNMYLLLSNTTWWTRERVAGSEQTKWCCIDADGNSSVQMGHSVNYLLCPMFSVGKLSEPTFWAVNYGTTLDQLIQDIKNEDCDPEEKRDYEITSTMMENASNGALFGHNWYKTISVEDGQIVGRTTTDYKSAVYLNTIEDGKWWYVGENTMELVYMGDYEGSIYLFEIAVGGGS